MNFSQLHERLRQELLRRIQRGTLSVSLLARQTGLGQPHLSNFLNQKRSLSLDAIDRILAAQQIAVDELLPATRGAPQFAPDPASGLVPLTAHPVALFEPHIRPANVQSLIHLPPGLLGSLRPRCSAQRRQWQRFVAVRIPTLEALPMDPIVLPDAIALIDRHYNSLNPYRPNRPNLYAIRHGARLVLRYADFHSNRLILRPHSLLHPVELLEIPPTETPNDLLAGRIALLLNEH